MLQAEQMAAAAATAAVVSTGRADQRGQGDYRPGADVASAQRGMGAMKLDAGSQGGPMTKRRGALLFISEPHTKPEHITDKTGGICVIFTNNFPFSKCDY